MKTTTRLLAGIAASATLTAALLTPAASAGTGRDASSPQAATLAAAAVQPATISPGYTYATVWSPPSAGDDPAAPKTVVLRWDPCVPIKVYVNPTGMPTGALPVIRTTLKRLSSATGYRLFYAGPTDIVPWNEAGKPGVPLSADDPRYVDSAMYIGWMTPTDYPFLAGAVAGGGSAGLSWPTASDEWRIANGGVAMDRTNKLPVTTKRGPTVGYLLMHEIAHVLNLGHVPNKRDIMYEILPKLSTSEGLLTPGATRGLKALSAKGCFSLDGA